MTRDVTPPRLTQPMAATALACRAFLLTAATLVRLKIDVIVVSGATAALAAQNATKAIPIFMAFAADPVASGLVESLARPRGQRHA